MKFLSYIGIFLFILSIHTCEKFEPTPLLLVITDTITEIKAEGIYIDGTVIHVGEEDISQHGFCWSESSNPSIDLETKSQQGARSTQGSFQWAVSGLTHNTTYSIRAYATDEKGTIYGELKTFTTKTIAAPELTTSLVEELTFNSALTGGEISFNGGSEILSRGVCWSTSQAPTIEDKFTEDGDGDGVFESSITGLDCGTTYYVRAYASNKTTTGYGEQLDFTTVECPHGMPEVVTTSIKNITVSTAEGGGEVIDQGTSDVVARGVCWSTERNPEVSDPHTVNGEGEGIFTSSITGLSCGTYYYVRAYATNGVGTNYGELDSFQTAECLIFPPEVISDSIINITQTSAQGVGNVINDGGAEVISRGICWGTSPEPTLQDKYSENGSGIGSFLGQMTELQCGTVYFARVYATNSEHTAYGVSLEFTTADCIHDPPTISTLTVSNITQTSAEGGGDITDDGGTEITAKGLCWSTSLNPDLTDSHTDEGEGAGEFFSEMTGLSCNTQYYVRAYATNSQHTSFGLNEEFVTGICLSKPTVTTAIITEITDIKAKGGGEVTNNGNSPIISRGVCWSTSPTPTIDNFKTTDGSELGLFESQITGLSPKTTYYLRAYATNSVGPGYGDEISFVTWDGSVTDVDENLYQTVQIGDQVWMKTNLNVSKYADGTPIRFVSNGTEWDDLSTSEAAYCWYDNDPGNGETYGALYTWPAAMGGATSSDGIPSGVQGVCPDNWHLPSDAEWKELEKYVGMSASEVEKVDYRGINEGLKLKEVGTLHWNAPNAGATDEYDFTALPGGFRRSGGGFENLTLGADFWTSTDSGSKLPWFRYFGDDSSRIGRWNLYPASNGLSVRCIED